MTTIAATPVTTKLRLTVRGRRVLTAMCALPVVVAAIVMASAAGSALATSDQGAASGTFDTVTIAAGDSLWTIAADYAPGHDLRDVVDEIITLNGLATVVLQPGQELALPPEYASAR